MTSGDSQRTQGTPPFTHQALAEIDLSRSGTTAIQVGATAHLGYHASLLTSGGNDLSPWLSSTSKRLMDCAIAAFLIILLIPLLVSLYAVVICCSGRPAIYKQGRLGYRCKPFTIYKFRTMVDAGSVSAGRSHSRNPRITWEGRFLRKYKFDELPQLLNILRGDMSLIGPRPKVPQHETDCLPCRPGLTGPASLAFAAEEELLKEVPEELLEICHAQVITPRKRMLDRKYMRTASLRSDISILVCTLLRLRRVESLPELSRFVGHSEQPVDESQYGLRGEANFETVSLHAAHYNANSPERSHNN